MTPPLVSIVVPTRNRAHLLPRLLLSLLAQDTHDIEIVVVDDASDDRTPEVLAACPDRRVRTVRQPRAAGVSRARNAGTEAATGRWVAWCDDDDLWAPFKLRLQLEAVAGSSGALWCNGGAAVVDSALRLRRTVPCPPPGRVLELLLQRNIVTGGGSGVLAERELALSVGGFDAELSIYADWHMWARLAAAAPLAVVDRPLVAYVNHSGGMSHDRRRLLSELVLLRAAFASLADHLDAPVEMDDRQLGAWMLREQVSPEQRLDNFVLPFQLARRGMLPAVRAIPHSVLGLVRPSALRQRWRRQEWAASAPRHLQDAESWLCPRRDAEQQGWGGIRPDLPRGGGTAAARAPNST